MSSKQDGQFVKITQKKEEIRLQIKARRSVFSREAIRIKSKHIQQRLLSLESVSQAETVMCYVSKSNEVETHELIKKLLRLGKTVAVPFIVSRGIMEPAVISSFSELIAAEFQVLCPQKLELLHKPIDLNIMPALAVSKTGERIGWGGGYYDRFIKKYKPKFNLCLAFDFQVFDELPQSESDQKVDGVVTEKEQLVF